MQWFKRFCGRSDSSFVEEEVLKHLPISITIKFLSEFDKDDNPIIFICSPDYDGLISEAQTSEEAISNAQDAILTYFNVPRAVAALIEFNIETVTSSSPEDGQDSIRIRKFKVIKEAAYA